MLSRDFVKAPSMECPAAFPFPTEGPPPYHGAICYNTKAAASAGEGPCGSWCTKNVSDMHGVMKQDLDWRVVLPVTMSLHVLQLALV